MSRSVSVTDAVPVAASPDAVWEELVAELSGAGRWWSVTNSFVADGDPARAGTVVHWTVRPNGRSAPGPAFRFTSTTRAAQPGNALELEFDGDFTGTGLFTVDARTEDVTTLRFRFDAQPTGWVGWLGRVVDIAAGHSRGTRAAFVRLRQELECGRLIPPRAQARLCGQGGGSTVTHRLRTGYGDDIAVVEWAPARWQTEAGSALLFHGWGSTGRAYDAVTEALLRDGHRVVVVDLPGHGESRLSTHGPITLERVAAVIDAVTQQLSTAPAVVVAHSGAALATVMSGVGASSARGLVLLSAAFRDAGVAKPELVVQGSPVLSAALRHPSVAESLLSRTMGPSMPPPSRPMTAARLRAVEPKTRRAYFEASHALDVTVFARSLALPCLVLAGEEDRVVSPMAVRASALALPKARFRQVRGVGHALPEEAPEAVAAAVHELLGAVAR